MGDRVRERPSLVTATHSRRVRTAQRRPPSWCEHMNVSRSRADLRKHNSSPVCVYLTVSAVDVAVVLPVEGAVDRAVLFSS